MEKTSTYLLIDVINRHIREIDNKLDNMGADISNYIKKIDPKLNDREAENIAYIATIILKELCRRSANVECMYDLSEKDHILYNLRKGGLEEVIGRTFLAIMPYLDHYSSRIPYDHIRYLENKAKSAIEEFLHYKERKSEVKMEKAIDSKLEGVYRAVGSEILRKLKEMNMIEIIETEKQENSPVYVRISDKAREFIINYEDYRTMDSEYEHKIIEYD